ncbi:hypothetical protein ACN6K9_006693, partial [Streptomyces sp. SAS_267]
MTSPDTPDGGPDRTGPALGDPEAPGPAAPGRAARPAAPVDPAVTAGPAVSRTAPAGPHRAVTTPLLGPGV